MGWQPTSYSLLLALAAVMAAVLAVYARSRRGTPGAREVALLLLAVFVWCAAYAAESASTGLALKVFLAKVEYLGIASAPLAWFAFALAYTGRGRWLTGRNLALLAVIPAVTLLLVATNEAHGLVWSSTALESSFLVVEHGAWFWVFWIYSYSMLVLGTYFLVSMLARSPGIYRRQGAALLVAVAAPWVGNGMYVLGLNPFPHLDLTPFAFLISGTAVSWGLFRFRFLEIVPVARDALVEVMEDGVIVVDPGGRVVDLNPAAQRVLDTTASEAVGEHLSRLSPVLDDLIDGYGAANGDLVAHKEVDLGGKEGAGRSYDLVLSSLRDRGSRRTGRLLVLRDVTERKHAEEEMIRQGVELARSNAELEHFAYLVAHDLRAPLRGINGFSQILLEDHANTLDDEGRDYLSRIRSGTLRMERLIDELLELSRLTRATMRRERVDLSEIARDVSSELRRGDPGREAEFVIADGLEANGDPHLLHVLLWNLLDNAWKFTQREPEARIELGAERRPEGPVFFVRDNGAGFEMAYADKLFKAFQRLHTSEEFEGTGIGLATVQRVVERHGGRVWAEGEVGRGATFYFTL